MTLIYPSQKGQNPQKSYIPVRRFILNIARCGKVTYSSRPGHRTTNIHKTKLKQGKGGEKIRSKMLGRGKIGNEEKGEKTITKMRRGKKRIGKGEKSEEKEEKKKREEQKVRH